MFEKSAGFQNPGELCLVRHVNGGFETMTATSSLELIRVLLGIGLGYPGTAEYRNNLRKVVEWSTRQLRYEEQGGADDE